MIRGFVETLTLDGICGWLEGEELLTQKPEIIIARDNGGVISFDLANIVNTAANRNGKINFEEHFESLPDTRGVGVFAKFPNCEPVYLPILLRVNDTYKNFMLGHAPSGSYIFPEEFEYEYYVSSVTGTKPSYAEAQKDFYDHGKKEGKAGAPLCNPLEFGAFFLRAFKSKNILEIGPGHFPRMKGENVKYYDYMSADQLREYAIEHKLPLENIPARIHYCSPEADFSVVDEKFDLIFSSHNMEHQVDLIQHFREICGHLNEDGIFACIIPDKDYTFDYFREPTALEDVIAQHYDPRQRSTGHPRHPLRNYLELILHTAHPSTMKHWNGDHGVPAPRSSNYVHEKIASFIKHPGYFDYHRWVFTASSFVNLFNELKMLHLVPMDLIRCYNTIYGDNSFCCIFKRSQNDEGGYYVG